MPIWTFDLPDDAQPILLLSVQGTHLPYKGLCTIERTERPLALRAVAAAIVSS